MLITIVFDFRRHISLHRGHLQTVFKLTTDPIKSIDSTLILNVDTIDSVDGDTTLNRHNRKTNVIEHLFFKMFYWHDYITFVLHA